MQNKELTKYSPKEIWKNVEGRVGPPVLLWFLGVPGSICLLLWLFVWRDK